MQYAELGRTGLTVSRTAFGAIPIQRISFEDAAKLMLHAFDAGVNFYDTAHGYSDSEEKIGRAFAGKRDEIIIATKTPARETAAFWDTLELSLKRLGTDYIDIYQFHNPPAIPRPGDLSGLYEAALDAQAQGKIRHIGITFHDADKAVEAAESGLFATIQYPLSYLSDKRDLSVVDACARQGLGFIAMKAMSGGLLRYPEAAFAYLRQFAHVVPIWGLQRMEELDTFLKCERQDLQLDETLRAQIEDDREALSGNFCRGCGYCQPCPQGIMISMAARMNLMMRRSVPANMQTKQWRDNMALIDRCTQCGECEQRCPYHLKPYELLPRELELYRAFPGF